MRRRIRVVLSLLLPIVAVALLIGRAELVVQGGTEWAVPIGGYDPRDLLRGHYLRYRLTWQVESDGCGGDPASCCYCLWDAGARGAHKEPAVSLISCADRAPCESYFPKQRIDDLEKFYIPEGEGARLERAIREKPAALLIGVSKRGQVVVKDLLLDGRPYREVLR